MPKAAGNKELSRYGSFLRIIYRQQASVEVLTENSTPVGNEKTDDQILYIDLTTLPHARCDRQR
jgi:hypothetical protein